MAYREREREREGGEGRGWEEECEIERERGFTHLIVPVITWVRGYIKGCNLVLGYALDSNKLHKPRLRI